MDGTLYRTRDDAPRADKARANRLCTNLNALPLEDTKAREEILRELFGTVGQRPCVMPHFHCDNGKNIHVGDDFLANYNVTILDRATVQIGDHVLIAPNVTITTATHPMRHSARRDGYGIASPVTIGDDVWIGANAVILPGVTIGDRVVVAAGAVVTKDLPDDCLALGVPAKVTRMLP